MSEMLGGTKPFAGSIAWAAALPLAVSLATGGYVGVGIARRLGERWLRPTVVIYGVFMAVVFIFRAR